MACVECAGGRTSRFDSAIDRPNSDKSSATPNARQNTPRVAVVNINWPEPNDWVVLSADDVHVWTVPLNAPGARLAEFTARLTDEERLRADRFMREDVRRRFIVARAGLRTILGRYLAMPPEDVPIAIGSHGKPQFGNLAEANDLQFNLSHSGELALVAIARGCDVGVDVEQVRTIEHWQEIAARYFHPAEVAAIAAVPEAERNALFLRCWTQKEAILKALGIGLGRSLQSFAVGVNDDVGHWVELKALAASMSRWYWLQSMAPTAGYVAAIATAMQRTVALGIVGDICA
jgi:4'-phosphopantetheinyl transferase